MIIEIPDEGVAGVVEITNDGVVGTNVVVVVVVV